MFIDSLLRVSAAQAVTATAVSASSIDMSSVAPRVGTGEALGFMVTVDVAADHTTGDETYQIDLISSATADLGTPTVILSRVLLYSQLTAGSKHDIPIPMGNPTQQFLGLRYTTGGTTPTVTVTAELMPREMASLEPRAYAKNYVV